MIRHLGFLVKFLNPILVASCQQAPQPGAVVSLQRQYQPIAIELPVTHHPSIQRPGVEFFSACNL